MSTKVLSELIHKSIPATLDVSEVTEGSFEGYASLWNTPDISGDEVVKGAFQHAIDRRGVGGIRMLFQHDPNRPIGVWEVVREDDHGLFVRGKLTKGVRHSSEVLSLLRSGAIDGLSIGFRPVKTVRNRMTKRRILKDIDLWEISVVTFPMLTGARVRNVKSAYSVNYTQDTPANNQLTRRHWISKTPISLACAQLQVWESTTRAQAARHRTERLLNRSALTAQQRRQQWKYNV